MNARMQADGTPVVLLAGADWPAITAEMVEAWPVVCQALLQYTARHPDDPWDRVRLHARFEAGLVSIAAAVARPDREMTVFGLSIPHLAQTYDELPDADEPDFDDLHDQMGDALYAALRRSAVASHVLAALCALRRGTGLVTLVEYDDLDTERVLVGPADLAQAA